MLRFDRVSFQYPGAEAPTLEGLSFRVEPGEFVSVIGASGCGKSTVLRLAAGLLSPDSGTVCVGGKSVAGRRSDCGYMPQHDLLFPWRTVEENVRLPLEIRGGLSKAEQRDMAAAALESVGLGGWGARSPGELSGGMRQRAAFARTILTGAELLLLDEPFSALDYLTRLGMREWLLEQWQREKKTVLFITHDVEEAVFLSGRVLAAEEKPISRLREAPVPLGWPRTRETLGRPEALELKETLIAALRRGGA